MNSIVKNTENFKNDISDFDHDNDNSSEGDITIMNSRDDVIDKIKSVVTIFKN